MAFKCDCCNYQTNYQTNYTKHLNTKKHSENEKKINEPKFSCKYCGQKYKFKQSVSKHIKYSCTKNKDEDLKELVRLLNNQLEQQKNELQSQIHNQSKQIEKLMGKLEININTTNIQNIKNIGVGIVTILDF